METPKNQKNEICTIRIAFPVESDDKAMEVKKKLSEVLQDIEGVKLSFGITNTAMPLPYG